LYLIRDYSSGASPSELHAAGSRARVSIAMRFSPPRFTAGSRALLTRFQRICDQLLLADIHLVVYNEIEHPPREMVFDIGHRKWINRGAMELLSEPPANIQIDPLSSDEI